MENFVSIGSVCGRHYVIATEDGVPTRIGPFPTHGEACTVAASECLRLGLPPVFPQWSARGSWAAQGAACSFQRSSRPAPPLGSFTDRRVVHPLRV